MAINFPSSPTLNQIYIYNDLYYTWNGSAWVSAFNGGLARGTFYENMQTIDYDYTITPGTNAMTAGPITIANNVTVTVGTGETWTIV